MTPAWLSAGTVELEFLDSVTALCRHSEASALLTAPISYRSGPHLSGARTAIAGRFLDLTDAEYLLMLDSDMVFAPDDVLRLIAAADLDRAPVVGGCYFGIGTGRSRVPEFQPTGEPAVGQLLPVKVIGAGLLLVHRSVLERLLHLHGPPLPCFAETVTDEGRVLSHDWVFCHRVRHDLGLPLYVHQGVQLGHVKRLTVGCEPSRDRLTTGVARLLGTPV